MRVIEKVKIALRAFYTTFCFRSSLRTGCFIFGYLSLVLNFFAILQFVAALMIMASLTHEFRYIQVKQTQTGDILLMIGCLNVFWIVLNTLLLMELHKKKLGHVKCHVTVSKIRLILSTIFLIYGDITLTTFYWMEMIITAYFTMLYHQYAKQLEQMTDTEKSTKDKRTEIAMHSPNQNDSDKQTEQNTIKIIHVTELTDFDC